MVKRKVPNVVRGGIAIPLGNNYYYMRGRKHEYGGIDIGENSRTGIEVEDKEIVHVGNNDLKVYSAQPFLGGLSPAERIIRGDNPIDVFNAQEDYKRRNKLNDDGTRKKKNGGLSRSKDYDSKSKPYPNVKSKDFAGKNRSYPIPTKADAVDALRLAGLHGRNDVKAKVYRRYPELRKKAELGIEAKNYRNGGIYSITSNGKTSLRYLPKLESNKYKKFEIGGDKDNNNTLLNRASHLFNTIDYYINKTKNSRSVNEAKENLHNATIARKLIDKLIKGNHVSTIESEINDITDYQFPQVATFEKNGDINIIETQDSDKNVVDDKEYILDYISAPYRVENLNDDTEVYIKNPFYNRALQKYGGKTKTNFRHKYQIGGDNYYTPDYYADPLLSPEFIINDTSLVPYTYPSLIYGYRYYPTEYTGSTRGTRKSAEVPTITESEVNSMNTSEKSVPRTTTIKATTTSTNNSPILNYKFKPGTDVTNIEQLMLRGLDRNPKPIGNTTLNVTYNPNYTMRLAEDRNPRIKRDKQRTIRRDARTRTGSPFKTFGLNMMDLIGAGANTLASLAGFTANRRMLNDMKYTTQPNLEMAAKLKTNYNINPRLAAVREVLAQTINDVNRNTSSSNVALARNQAALNNALLTADQLYALKENEETKLINADRINRQEVANKNVQSYNKWLKDKTEFENNIRELKSENEVGLYNNLNSVVQNVVNNILKRRSDDNTITAMMAANPDLPIEMLEDLGLITHAQANMYRKQYPLRKN